MVDHMGDGKQRVHEVQGCGPCLGKSLTSDPWDVDEDRCVTTLLGRLDNKIDLLDDLVHSSDEGNEVWNPWVSRVGIDTDLLVRVFTLRWDGQAPSPNWDRVAKAENRNCGPSAMLLA